MQNKSKLSFNIKFPCKTLLTVSILLFLQFFLNAQPVLNFELVEGNFNRPVDIKYAGNDPATLFIVEQKGKVIEYNMTTKTKTIFLDISNIIKFSGQKGLLGIAFDPAYSTNRRFFVYYNELHTSNITVDRYYKKINAEEADTISRVTLLSLPKPYGGGIHNGGCMHFGNDGFLYIGLGDGSPKGDPHDIAQNGHSLFGKILRLNVNVDVSPYYQIPADNPFINNPDVDDEIWAMGLRNPWRFSFDRLTHDLWIGDVGQKYFEEIDYATPANAATGLNFGWRCFEGNASYKTEGCQEFAHYTAPVLAYDHLVAPSRKQDGSVIGGYVYRGSSYPSLYGWYISGDYMLGVDFLIKPDGAGGWISGMQSDVPKFTTFGEDQSGEMYGADLDGNLYKLAAAPLPPPAFTQKSKAVKSQVYPTVVQNNITIEMTEQFSAISITDMNGHEVLKQPLPSTKINTMQLSIPALPAGMYILQLIGKTTEQHKIIIEH